MFPLVGRLSFSNSLNLSSAGRGPSLARIFLVCALNFFICSGVKNSSAWSTIQFSERSEKLAANSGLSVTKIALACLGLNSVMSRAVP